MIAHLVDYDWPIAGGRETATSIPDQILVMEQICALTAGRVHCFAPFDPMKQVAYELGGFASLFADSKRLRRPSSIMASSA